MTKYKIEWTEDGVPYTGTFRSYRSAMAFLENIAKSDYKKLCYFVEVTR